MSAMAKMNYRSTSSCLLFDAVAEFAWRGGRFGNTLTGTEVEDLKNVVVAFATMRHRSGSFFHAVGRDSRRIVMEGGLEAVGDVVWAFAAMNHRCDSLFDLVVEQSERLVANMGGDESSMLSVSKILWGFAIAGCLLRRGVAKMVVRLC